MIMVSLWNIDMEILLKLVVGNLQHLHGWAKKDEDLMLGWHHTMNPSGYGISEEDVQWGWTEIQQFGQK